MKQVTKAMTELDVGALPVCDGARLIGMVKVDSADLHDSLPSISEPDQSGQSQANGRAGGGSATGEARRAHT